MPLFELLTTYKLSLYTLDRFVTLVGFVARLWRAPTIFTDMLWAMNLIFKNLCSYESHHEAACRLAMCVLISGAGVCVSVWYIQTHMSVEVILNLEFNSSHLSVLIVCPMISTKCLIIYVLQYHHLRFGASACRTKEDDERHTHRQLATIIFHRIH